MRFAQESALVAGMDLSHVFCEKSAGTAIKGYSPELIVHPVLIASEDNTESEVRSKIDSLAEAGASAVKEWIPRLDALLIGPGLGRNRATVLAACHIITAAAERGLPIVLDADGLFILSSALQPGEYVPSDLARKMLSALAACPVTLTPNRVEFERLCQALGLAERGSGSFERRAELAPLVSKAIGELTIVVAKGGEDVISDGTQTITCGEEGSPRRCGGQGDVLAGLLLAMRAWSETAITVRPPAQRSCTGTVEVAHAADVVQLVMLRLGYEPEIDSRRRDRLTAGRRAGQRCGGAESTAGWLSPAPSPRAPWPAGRTGPPPRRRTLTRLTRLTRPTRLTSLTRRTRLTRPAPRKTRSFAAGGPAPDAPCARWQVCARGVRGEAAGDAGGGRARAGEMGWGAVGWLPLAGRGRDVAALRQAAQAARHARLLVLAVLRRRATGRAGYNSGAAAGGAAV
jgi:ATP-dependent NAD(P)H-hydrate dehydratase